MLVSPEVPGYQVSASLPSANESENDAGEVLGVAWLFFKYPSSNLSLLEILPACSQKNTRLMEIIKKTRLAMSGYYDMLSNKTKGILCKSLIAVSGPTEHCIIFGYLKSNLHLWLI